MEKINFRQLCDFASTHAIPRNVVWYSLTCMSFAILDFDIKFCDNTQHLKKHKGVPLCPVVKNESAKRWRHISARKCSEETDTRASSIFC